MKVSSKRPKNLSSSAEPKGRMRAAVKQVQANALSSDEDLRKLRDRNRKREYRLRMSDEMKERENERKRARRMTMSEEQRERERIRKREERARNTEEQKERERIRKREARAKAIRATAEQAQKESEISRRGAGKIDKVCKSSSGMTTSKEQRKRERIYEREERARASLRVKQVQNDLESDRARRKRK